MCFDVSKAITRFLEHDQTVPGGSNAAIQYSDIIEECRKKTFDGAPQWTLAFFFGQKEEELTKGFNIV